MHEQSTGEQNEKLMEAEAPTEPNLPVSRKAMRELAFKLSEADFAAKAKQVAEAQQKLGKLASEFQGVKDNYKARIQLLENEIGHILAVISSGVEQREVECDERVDYDRGIVEYVFNGEVRAERPMTPMDRQQSMSV